jgi:hypothetical protein
MSSQSPLKLKPLRLPGESVDDEIVRLREGALMDHLFAAACVVLLAAMEWFGYLTNSGRHPWAFTALAVVTVGYVAQRIWGLRKTIRQLRHGRDGERIVAEQLECMREQGAQVFHDVPGEGFNLDHVVISTHGIYAVETKTRSKPSPRRELSSKAIASRSRATSPIEIPLSKLPQPLAGWKGDCASPRASVSSCAALWSFRDGM